MNEEHELLDRLVSNPAHIPGDSSSPPPGHVIIYTSDGVPIFYLFRGGMEMFCQKVEEDDVEGILDDEVVVKKPLTKVKGLFVRPFVPHLPR